MDTAGRTCRLGSTEAALVQLHAGIMDKFFAFIARNAPGMMLAAIQCDHLFYGYFFYIYSIIAIIFHNDLMPLL